MERVKIWEKHPFVLDKGFKSKIANLAWKQRIGLILKESKRICKQITDESIECLNWAKCDEINKEIKFDHQSLIW